MSGHSHWATIKRAKEKQDSQKGKVFGKVAREIQFAIQKGGGVADPANNVYLRAALEKAKEYNVPKENVQRLLDKNAQKAANLTEIMYEAFGPGNTSLLIKCVTDNTNRTLSEVRFAVNSNGGKMGTPNSVLFLFQKVGELALKNAKSEDDALACIDAMGAQDFEMEEGIYYVYVGYEALSQALSVAKDNGFDSTPQITYLPTTMVEVPSGAKGQLEALMDALHGLEDVQEVYTNAEAL